MLLQICEIDRVLSNHSKTQPHISYTQNDHENVVNKGPVHYA